MQLDFCPNCFAAVGTMRCPKCGFDIDQYQPLPVTLPPGTILNGKYKLGRVLGIGGFGITYMGYDMQKQVLYAIKEYMPNDIAVRESNFEVCVANHRNKDVYNKGLDMFLYETNILITLSGTKGIVEAHDFVMENNTAYMVMEYIDGVNLKALMAIRGTLESEFALSILFEVAGALRVVHSKGLLHRDISPENIMVLNDGTVKLIDFGAARFYAGERSKSLSLILKHGFAPPEQYSTNGNQGQWTDIYALAATYYKVVTGQTLPDALSRATHDTVERLDKNYPMVKPYIGKAIYKALALNYRERYQTIEQFIHDLRIPEQPKQESIDNKQSIQITEKSKKKSFTEWFFGNSKQKASHTTNAQHTTNSQQEVSHKSRKVPYVRFTSGPVTVGLWDLPDNMQINIGRDSSACGIVVPGSELSRKHCSIVYNPTTEKFIIEDYSSNGTYFGNGERLAGNVQYALEPGSVVMLASPNHTMEVGLR